MNYRLLALDLDGTLLNSQMQIQSATIEAVRRVRERGVKVMLVTGRHHLAAYPYWDQLQLDLPAVCGNGAYIYDFRAGCTLANNPLTKLQAKQVVGLLRKHDIFCLMYVDHAMAYQARSHHREKLMRWAEGLAEAVRPRFLQVEHLEDLIDKVDTVWKFDTASDDPLAIHAFAQEVRETAGLSCEWSSANDVDLVQQGNSKGSRLAEWLAPQGIEPGEVIAFGDQKNDIDMLELAGMGVAMGNADAAVQACADWVTGGNDGNGIADALQRFVLRGV